MADNTAVSAAPSFSARKSRSRMALAATMSKRSQFKSKSKMILPATQEDEEEYEDDEEEEMADELMFASDNSLEAKRKKLFVRPKKKKVICGLEKKKQKKQKKGGDGEEDDEEDDEEEETGDDQDYNTDSVPAVVKLTMRRKTALDLIKDRIPQPEGSVPPTALPTWFEFDMDSKIPMVPAPLNYVYYSRGKLGTKLHRCHPFYIIYDERNIKRVVKTPYNALHDPHVKSYFSKPNNIEFLIKQGFINEKGEVMCSFQEFNQFRSYLSTLFNDQVSATVSCRDSCAKFQRDISREVLNYMSKVSGRKAVLNSRRARARALNKETRQNMLRKHESKEKQSELQMAHWKEERAKENLMRVIVGYERDKKSAERLYRVRLERLMSQREILKTATMKDIEADERKKTNQMMVERAGDAYKINWLDNKLEFGRRQMERDKQIEESLRSENEENAKKRQRKVEWMRKMMPEQIEKKKAEKRRLWEIVRKYAMRWLEKVRKRLNAPKDDKHESVWIGKSKGVMDDTLKYLKELSGYEKLDDFILNIIKLKRQIQHQIELEEAEEAAAAKAAEAENDEKLLAEDEPPTPSEKGSTTTTAVAPSRSRVELEE